MSKAIAPLLFLFISSNLNAQNFEKLLEKGKFEKIENKLKKDLVKEPEDVSALYWYSRLYQEKTNSTFDLYKAYVKAINAEDAFEKMDVAKQKRLDKGGINFKTLQENRLSICKKSLDEIDKSPTISGYEAFFNKFNQCEMCCQKAVIKRDSLAFLAASQINTTEGFQQFIEKYPKSALLNDAIAKREKLAFTNAVTNNSLEAYEAFIKEYPTSQYVTAIQLKRDSTAYFLAEKENTEQSYMDFVKNYPHANQSGLAKKKQEEAAFVNAVKDSSRESLEKFEGNYPNGRYSTKIKEISAEIAFKASKKLNTIEAFKDFVEEYPNAYQSAEAKRLIDSIQKAANIQMGSMNSKMFQNRILKTYSGNWKEDETDYGISGKATYQYYEDDNNNRIYNGNFKVESASLVITGHYSNNLKDGFWKYINKGDYQMKHDWSFKQGT